MSLERRWWKTFWKSSTTVCLLHRVPTYIFLSVLIFSSFFPNFPSSAAFPRSLLCLPNSYFDFISFFCLRPRMLPVKSSKPTCVLYQSSAEPDDWQKEKNAGCQAEPPQIVKPSITVPPHHSSVIALASHRRPSQGGGRGKKLCS